jgi:acyl-coenzyme A thioesterase PaaI-like protein
MLNICYLAPEFDGEVIALERVRRSGRSLYFAEAELHCAQGSLLATGRGTFKHPRAPVRSV